MIVLRGTLKRMVFKKFFKAFYYAGRGIGSSLSERNVRFHVGATAVVLVAGMKLGLSQIEWYIVLLLIGSVISAELVNTAIEDLANHVRDDLKISYGATARTRDVAAGAVLVLAIVAACIGSMIFVPKLLRLF